jgi:hypothetical protein
MDPVKLIDNTLYYSLSSAVIENIGVVDIVDKVVPDGYVSEKIRDAVIMGTILEGVNIVGDKFHNNGFDYVRHLGTKIQDLIKF